MILDYAGNFHPDSLKFLTAAAGKDGKSALSFYRKECTAAICRLIGYMDQRSIHNRMKADAPPVDPRLTEAMELYFAEQAEAEAAYQESASGSDSESDCDDTGMGLDAPFATFPGPSEGSEDAPVASGASPSAEQADTEDDGPS